MAVTTGEMRTTSLWALSPTSASWINTSTSKRRLKVGSAVAGGSAWCTAWCLSDICLLFSSARKESAKEKQLKEEEKILESVAEGRGMVVAWAGRKWTDPPPPQACYSSEAGPLGKRSQP